MLKTSRLVRGLRVELSPRSRADQHWASSHTYTPYLRPSTPRSLMHRSSSSVVPALPLRITSEVHSSTIATRGQEHFGHRSEGDAWQGQARRRSSSATARRTSLRVSSGVRAGSSRKSGDKGRRRLARLSDEPACWSLIRKRPPWYPTW